MPAVLNYTTGSGIMLSCCRLAGLKQVIASKAFIERSKLDLQALTSNGVSIVWLEDVRQAISAGDKWRARETPAPARR